MTTDPTSTSTTTEQENTTMTTTTDSATIRAWIGCLGCYADGRLHGDWIEPDEEHGLDVVGAGLAQLATYDTSPKCSQCGSDEWWIMDHEGIPWLTGECSPAEFVAWADEWADVDDPEMVTNGTYLPRNSNELADAIGKAEDTYTYCATIREYAEELASEVLDDRDDLLARYFDYDAFARDLSYGDVFECNGYVFRNE